MPENERTPRADVIDVLVAIGIEDVRTLPAHDEGRIAAHGTKSANRRIHATGNHLLGALLQLAGYLRLAGHGLSEKKLVIYGNSGRPLDREKPILGGASSLFAALSTGLTRVSKDIWNSPDIYSFATVLKHVLGTLCSVHALLTGRVLRTASGGSELSSFILHAHFRYARTRPIKSSPNSSGESTA